LSRPCPGLVPQACGICNSFDGLSYSRFPGLSHCFYKKSCFCVHLWPDRRTLRPVVDQLKQDSYTNGVVPEHKPTHNRSGCTSFFVLYFLWFKPESTEFTELKTQILSKSCGLNIRCVYYITRVNSAVLI